MLKQTSESEYFGRYKIGSKKKCRLIYIQYIDATTDHITPCSRMRARGNKAYIYTIYSFNRIVLAQRQLLKAAQAKNKCCRYHACYPCCCYTCSICQGRKHKVYIAGDCSKNLAPTTLGLLLWKPT